MWTHARRSGSLKDYTAQVYMHVALTMESAHAHLRSQPHPLSCEFILCTQGVNPFIKKGRVDVRTIDRRAPLEGAAMAASKGPSKKEIQQLYVSQRHSHLIFSLVCVYNYRIKLGQIYYKTTHNGLKFRLTITKGRSLLCPQYCTDTSDRDLYLIEDNFWLDLLITLPRQP